MEGAIKPLSQVFIRINAVGNLESLSIISTKVSSSFEDSDLSKRKIRRILTSKAALRSPPCVKPDIVHPLGPMRLRFAPTGHADPREPETGQDLSDIMDVSKKKGRPENERFD